MNFGALGDIIKTGVNRRFKLQSSADGMFDNKSLEVTDLRCKYCKNPISIDIAEPHWSRVILSPLRSQKQSAYRVIVTSSIQLLNQNIGDMWDSGKIVSDQSIPVKYN
jgi:alpha-L-rhamnosidase